MKKPFIFFDIGGTLMDGPDKSPARRFCDALGLSDEEKEKINSFIFTENITSGENLCAVFKREFSDLTASASEKIKDIWDTQHKEGFEIKGALDTVRRVKESGFNIGIISNIWLPYYKSFCAIFNKYIDYFETPILSYVEGCKKPDLEIFKRAFSKLNISPEDACIVGDSYYHDIEPAKKLGMKTVWVLYNREREKEYLRKVKNGELPSPDFIIDKIEELKAYLKDLSVKVRI